jgi:subtilase family serine protease
LIAVLAVGLSIAVTTASASANSTPSALRTVTTLRAELRAGTLGQQHGVINVCTAHHLHCDAQVLTVSKKSKTELIFGQPIGYGATELEKAYGVSAATSTTATIAILDAGAYPNLESDLDIYRDTYGLPRCTTSNGCLHIKSYTGGAPLQPSSDPFTALIEEEVSVETALDVQMASAACPKCKIVELQLPPLDAAPDSQAAEDVAARDFGTATQTAVRMGASAVSISYGYDPDTYTDTGTPAKALRQPGVAVFASSGDGGAEPFSAAWPQDLPTVISAGGTSLYPSATARGYTEVAWAGAGSSCSSDLPPANGQPKSISSVCDGTRAASDISADADPNTGVAVYDSYAPATGFPLGFIVVGGTSASSPFLAGLYARAGVPKSVLGPNAIYRAPATDFHDVTVGTNALPGLCAEFEVNPRLCSSGPGWDGPTGVGTPVGLAPFKVAG